MSRITAEVVNLKRTDGWYAGTVRFSHGVELEFFVSPSGREVRFYKADGVGGGIGGDRAYPHRRALLVALGLPANAAGDEPKRRRAAPLHLSAIEARMPDRRMEDIADLVAERYEISVKEMRSPGRQPYLVVPRQEAMSLMRQVGWSTLQIGKFFNRDHSTVSWADAAHRRRLDAYRAQASVTLEAAE
ncbi:helix-turn-helix domain-containing protein [Phenylobacterium sp. J367]|uniref:helix-turn-helix domain-containing protein n=1 Tax=Phenylobacterium sp. J367 TaxID=2898435 RepID=UPI002151C1BF|nr:helix-turn-helix domain-containing protein [Phenylobacterium sp. J367]MCR5876950.1 hypothetical protein [Phenylobacterium sp. J367]MCR5877018.1 hypothetical protein [Phenylobacterium sp. J367]